MGFGEISLTKLVLVLAIVALLFGTKKLRNIAEDLGGAIRGFKEAMNQGEAEERESDRKPVGQIEQRTAGEDLIPQTTSSQRTADPAKPSAPV